MGRFQLTYGCSSFGLVNERVTKVLVFVTNGWQTPFMVLGIFDMRPFVLANSFYQMRAVGIAITAATQFCLAYVTLSIQAIYPVWSAPFWPASGAALAACILRGPWMLAGVYLGLALPNLTLWSTHPSWIGLVLPLGNVTETAAAWLMLRWAIRKFDYKFTKVNNVGWFLLIAPWIPAALSALIVQSSLLLAGIVPAERYTGEILVFWLGNATGIMLITPLILVWRDILQYQWLGAKGRKILFLIGSVSFALWLFHSEEFPTYTRMTSVLVIPLVVWGIWSTGFRGASLLCLLTSFFYFAFDVPNSRPLSQLLNQRHLQANISFMSALKVESPLNRTLPPPVMLEEALEQIGILTTICLTILPLGAASDELRRRAEQDDLVMQALDSTFWTWTPKDGIQFFNPKVAENLKSPPLLFEAQLPAGKMKVPPKDSNHPGYISHWAITEKGYQGEPLQITGILQSQSELSRRQAAEAKAELANLEIQALRAHLNPHLIFNCLAGLRGMIKTNPDLARDFTGRLASFLRAVVDSQASTLITLKHEIEICQDYLCLESIRGKIVSLRHQPKPYEANTFLPSLSVITLVENAVKHGTLDPFGKITIELESIKEPNGVVCIMVRNPGQMRDHGKGSNPGGLSLLQQQLKLLHHPDSRVEIRQIPGMIVEAEIHLATEKAS